MSTGQNYSGKGDSTTLFEPSALIIPPSHLLANNQPELLHSRIDQTQARLLDLSDEFVALGFADGPVQAIGELLTHWLATPLDQLTRTSQDKQLQPALLLADFLTQFYSFAHA